MRKLRLSQPPPLGLSQFMSCKCETPIPLPNILLHYALQQASLSPGVKAIRYQAASDSQYLRFALQGVILEQIDGNYLLKVYESYPNRDHQQTVVLNKTLQSAGLRLLERDSFDIKREPLFSNARVVWSHKNYMVALSDKLRIAALLNDESPLSILELEDRIRPSGDILAALCALACENAVEIDIFETPLGPHSIVREK